MPSSGRLRTGVPTERLDPQSQGTAATLLIEWQVAVHAGDAWNLEPFPEFVERTNLKADTLANRSQDLDLSSLQTDLPEAVAAMKSHMVRLQEDFSADMNARLEGTLADLDVFSIRMPPISCRIENPLCGSAPQKAPFD